MMTWPSESLAKAEAQLEQVFNYTNTSCDAIASSFLIGASEQEKYAGAKVADGVLRTINKIIQKAIPEKDDG